MVNRAQNVKSSYWMVWEEGTAVQDLRLIYEDWRQMRKAAFLVCEALAPAPSGICTDYMECRQGQAQRHRAVPVAWAPCLASKDT
jgi:hypothetical protein